MNKAYILLIISWFLTEHQQVGSSGGGNEKDQAKLADYKRINPNKRSNFKHVRVYEEASSRRLHEVNNKQQSYCLFTTDQQQAVHGADAMRSRNRKRFYNNSGSTIEIKRFCPGSCVCYGTGSAKDYGLTTMHSESTSLCLNSINDKTLDHSSVITESCCGAAGNHSLIYNPDYRQLSSSNGTESSDSSVELGELLFETHGCSIYHHYRQQQFAKHDIETEF
ncbi:PREDICTED: uncharacterized protein LOC106792269 isoform X2 [Polistes canadensis]|uniref:uncharacterized protein LOC106792269 isoform X2 n=1 Tax=Polistes canadensis TaxID=91411 RepID=UPI000718E4BB|nr:PREDICTED: uncharacterized protein LOC106792269 isoform X2 [Polistes canadensis]